MHGIVKKYLMGRCRRQGVVTVPYNAPTGLTWFWGSNGTDHGKAVHFRCRCGETVDDYDNGFTVDGDGTMTPDARCSECGFHAYLKLEEWDGGG